MSIAGFDHPQVTPANILRMSEKEMENRAAQIEPELREMKLDERTTVAKVDAESRDASGAPTQRSGTVELATAPIKTEPTSGSWTPPNMEMDTPKSADTEHEEMVGGDISLKLEPGKAPKLSRSASRKVTARPPQLFLHYADKTEEAASTFSVLDDCIYVPKFMGDFDPAIDCDCAEEWDSSTGTNHACGDDSDCVNRATKMECPDDSGCGSECQNKRFQRKQYASVSVMKTEKKGYGLRADTDLRPDQFIFEYIGEVINEPAFRKRMIHYDGEGIKHFYFMSLSKGEFIDATKKGNLGRFCNHSCNPNCYVDKWVVGSKLRMGIFAQRSIKAGEELVFNYNVDRYGANPQPCYCGEPNCTGFIGGKTQTERSTKLSNITIEALGIDDGDDWDLAVAKKPRKKKLGEDDEEYVNNVQLKSLDEDGVTKVMAALRQCKEKWIAVKLLSRIQRSDDERVRHRVVRMHGYLILKLTLANWMEDRNVVLQILGILDTLPRITRNKIQDSRIEEVVQKLASGEDEVVSSKAKDLLGVWAKLEIGYRIPRVKRDPNAVKVERFDRRDAFRPRSRSRSRTRSKSPPKGPKGPIAGAPAGPKGYVPPAKYNGSSRPPYRRPAPAPLPKGWHIAMADNKPYYYSDGGLTTWARPTAPAPQPTAASKEKTNEQKLQEIILSITKNSTPKDRPSSATATPANNSEAKDPSDKTMKWKSYSEDKQKKIYENTLFPHIKYVTDKYRHKLPKEDLKRFAKEISKKLVNSDYKHGRVNDPTKISQKQVKVVKTYVKDFFDKAAKKHVEHEKKKAAKDKGTRSPDSPSSTTPKDEPPTGKAVDGDDEMGEPGDNKQEVSPESAELSPRIKRKREESAANTDSPLNDEDSDEEASSKKFKIEPATLPPPPPPPPPDGYPVYDANGVDESEQLIVRGTGDTGSSDGSVDLFRGKHLDDKDSPSLSPHQLATPPTTTNRSCDNEHNNTLQTSIASRAPKSTSTGT